ncbi:MAG: TadE family protein, partial [Myxococcaceae bacterium]
MPENGARPDVQSGQAGVEAALTLPMVVFLILGTLQLFTMLQARVLAEYAAFWAVRTGSVNHGRCDRMLDSAVLALMPTITRTDSPVRLAEAFGRRRNHRFDPSLDDGRDGSIVWIQRERPLASALPLEEIDFDAPGALTRLEVRLVFWYPMRIPFANWVMSRMFLAHYGLRDYTAV